MTAYTGTPALPLLLAGDIPSAAVDWAGILAALHGLTDAWTTWSPTLTNLTVGTGVLTARYRQVGKTVDFTFAFTFGAGSAVGTSPTFTLPVVPLSLNVGRMFPATVTLLDASTAILTGFADNNAGGSIIEVRTDPYGTVTSTNPFTWTTPDAILAWGTYEAA